MNQIETKQDAPASWIIREKDTRKVIGEVFSPAIALAINAIRYEAVPILEYLQSLNEHVKQ